MTEFCGDGVQQTGEQCDDGNTTDNDGCNAQCVTEFCGDGVQQAGEQCDDGNNRDGDGCDAQCLNEFCGDGKQQAGEQCDDGNNVDNDGCNAQCVVEFCGDAITQPNEECDDGNTVEGDGCNSDCIAEVCGDGILQTGLGEQCDDGNATDDDGCSAQCLNEFCGDGVQQAGEQCDDGNTADNDGCSAQCLAESCGDGIQQAGEECDDGNNLDDDGCSAQCLAEVTISDCSGVPGGTAVVDRCGVCGGDGQSCLGCVQADNTDVLFAMDGGGALQRDNVKSAARLVRKRLGARFAKFAGNLEHQADTLYIDNWELTWTIPRVVDQCSNQVFCVETDFSAAVFDYDENARKLRKLTKKGVRKLRRETGNRKLGRRILKEANALLNENLALSSSAAVQASTCN